MWVSLSYRKPTDCSFMWQWMSVQLKGMCVLETSLTVNLFIQDIEIISNTLSCSFYVVYICRRMHVNIFSEYVLLNLRTTSGCTPPVYAVDFSWQLSCINAYLFKYFNLISSELCYLLRCPVSRMTMENVMTYFFMCKAETAPGPSHVCFTPYFN